MRIENMYFTFTRYTTHADITHIDNMKIQNFININYIYSIFENERYRVKSFLKYCSLRRKKNAFAYLYNIYIYISHDLSSRARRRRRRRRRRDRTLPVSDYDRARPRLVDINHREPLDVTAATTVSHDPRNRIDRRPTLVRVEYYCIYIY